MEESRRSVKAQSPVIADFWKTAKLRDEAEQRRNELLSRALPEEKLARCAAETERARAQAECERLDKEATGLWLQFTPTQEFISPFVNAVALLADRLPLTPRWDPYVAELRRLRVNRLDSWTEKPAIADLALLEQTNTMLEFKCTKSDNPHVVGLPASTLAALEEHSHHQDQFRQQFGPDYRADLDLIFANPDGTPLKPDSVSATVSVLCGRLKLPKGVSLHTLRHTHGSHLLANGVPLPVVSARLGHSSVRVTADIYSHAIHGQDDEAVRKWEEFQGRNVEPKTIGGVQ